MATKPRVELTILVHTTYRLMVELDDIPADAESLTRWMGYAEGHLTLNQAARLLIARAAHHRRHYLVAEWVKAPHQFRHRPEFTVAEWRELATVEPDRDPAQPAGQQLGLFGLAPAHRGPDLPGQREIAALIAGRPDDERIAHPDLVGYPLSDLLLRANKARHPQAPPVPTLDEVMA